MNLVIHCTYCFITPPPLAVIGLLDSSSSSDEVAGQIPVRDPPCGGKMTQAVSARFHIAQVAIGLGVVIRNMGNVRPNGVAHTTSCRGRSGWSLRLGRDCTGCQHPLAVLVASDPTILG
eukprot:534846-Rhodomonas_salina.2